MTECYACNSTIDLVEATLRFSRDGAHFELAVIICTPCITNWQAKGKRK